MKLKFIVEEVEGDLLTPIAIYQRISGKKKFLLESSLKHEDSGRFSFIGAEPVFELIANGDICHVFYKDGTTKVMEENPLNCIKKLLPSYKINEPLFPFIGGAVGYIGYDVSHHYLELNNGPQADELKMPDAHLMFFEEMIAFDHLKQKVYVVGIPLVKTTKMEELRARVEKRKKELTKYMTEQKTDKFSISSFQPSTSRSQYMEKVNTVKDYIGQEEVLQVVLSQKLTAFYKGNPLSFYRKLRVANPSPYMFFIDFDCYVLAGSSPESLVKVQHQYMYTNPIAGTRPRGKTQGEDLRLEVELLKDEKELKEHRMLVDLAQSELEQVCERHTINIDQYMKVEKFQHVMHIVSVLSGKLKASFHSIDALASCLPAGTVSGYPKRKAMELINELEETKRGPYSGAVGYVSANGFCDFSIAIRMMIMKDGIAHVQAGAGIVDDSVPKLEYEETMHKLRSLLEVEKPLLRSFSK
ncbi:anthranilate synthase component I [Bacillus aquiflavi]|uniref:Anthranilate synthase component 1 n=1 Tax=Bacillus aquiflavi TaxID=2672567 RepID=A0A6B3W3D4_9BACI|nr:anthranilate synthase component I [Bacillus aquiflavi]MBA4537151.1 anthranilate synthase component I [Bacillus aquiflavi]NEY82426.1 anthranilate synthase component I [Bacillus aquiflavi]UAC49775.1 anthranilate synthase component I [Bacillus aquiflavi]